MEENKMKENKTKDEMFKEDRLNENELEEVKGGVGLIEQQFIKSISHWTTVKDNRLYCNYCNFRYDTDIRGIAVMKMHLKAVHNLS
ncbi:MAG: hypothetical protein E7307_13365 [Butyrivibrio sp.]|nr:hypothetical protein [Butyrivibrio sp.]